MLGTILYLIYFFILALPLFILTTILAATTAIIGCYLGGEKVFGYYPGVIWSRIALALFLCPVKILGKEQLKKEETPLLIMANHQSALDIFLIYGYLGIPFRFILKESIRKIPFIGKFCEVAGFIYVDERRSSSIKKSMEEGKEVLRKGNSIVLFPEGHRSRNGEMLPLKRGGFRLAYQLQAKMLPVAIRNAYEALPYKKYIPRPKKLLLSILPTVAIDSSLCEQDAIAKALSEVEQALKQPVD